MKRKIIDIAITAVILIVFTALPRAIANVRQDTGPGVQCQTWEEFWESGVKIEHDGSDDPFRQTSSMS